MIVFKPNPHGRAVFRLFVVTAVAGFMFGSCENREGMGGTGSISGTIIERFYNDDFSDLIFQKPAVEEEVYIMFGEEEVEGDRTRTSITGGFRFDFLYPGSYSIYYSSEDSTGIPDDEWGEVVKVELGKGEDLDLGELVKVSTLNYDDGQAVIRGTVKKIVYDKDSSWPDPVIDYVDFAHEHEVYLTYGEHTFYDERVRTQFDGTFEFSNLIPGDYLVFLYSEDISKVTEHVVLKYFVTITEFDQVVDLGEIFIDEI